ncbi:MAG: RcnB family protein [Rhizobiaceae bacterium]|jgi:Ni/Co efflux regulator RcnB
MKRLVLATVALSLLAAPAAFAQPQDLHHKGPHPTHVVKKKVVKRVVVRKSHWQRGHRLPHGQHYVVVKDYGRYHLRRPPVGQHWVRVDNQYLLVGVTSGIIAALVNAQ